MFVDVYKNVFDDPTINKHLNTGYLLSPKNKKDYNRRIHTSLQTLKINVIMDEFNELHTPLQTLKHIF
jgi:hypothetical protein